MRADEPPDVPGMPMGLELDGLLFALFAKLIDANEFPIALAKVVSPCFRTDLEPDCGRFLCCSLLSCNRSSFSIFFLLLECESKNSSPSPKTAGGVIPRPKDGSELDNDAPKDEP